MDVEARIGQALDLERRGRLREAEQALREALALAPHDRHRRLHLARVLLHRGTDARTEGRSILRALLPGTPDAGGGPVRALLALAAWLDGDIGEARTLAQAVRAAAPDGADPDRAAALHVLGMVRFLEGEAEEGLRDLSEAASTFRALGDPVSGSRVLDSIGNLLTRRGRVADAEPYLRQSLELKRALGDRQGEAITLGNLGRVKRAQGALAEAEALFAQDLAIAREIGDARGVGITLNHLAEIARDRGDLSAAADRYEESLRADPSPRNRFHAAIGLARTLPHDAAAQRVRLEEARARLGEAGLPDAEVGAAWTAFVEAEGLALRGQPAEAIPALERAADGLRRGGVGSGLLEVLLRLSRSYESAHRPGDALRTAGEILALLDHYGAQERVVEVERWLRDLDPAALLALVMRRYLPSEYVDSLLGARPLGSARREVTVLFGDVRGFTAYAEATPAEEVTRTLNTWIRLLTPEIRAHHGTIDKFLGDGVMALFGAFEPEVGEDAATRGARDAAKAAVAVLEALGRFNAARTLTLAPAFRFGIGIATGEAVVGNVGSEAKMDFTAIGRPVNLASRLESSTKEFRWPLVVCDRTRRLLGEHVEAEARSGVAVRGLEGSVTVHLVRSVGGRPVPGW